MRASHTPTSRLWRTALPAALVIVGVIATGLILSAATAWTAGEMGYLRDISQIHSAGFDWLALANNQIFGPRLASLLIVLGVLTIAVVTRRTSAAAHFFVIVTVPWIGSEGIKLLVHRARPDIPSLAHPLIFEPGGLSFPSGHTTFVTCLVLGVLMISTARRLRIVVLVGGAILVLATAASRVYLGVHYPSDVIASIVYSVAGVVFVDSVWNELVVPHWNSRRARADGMRTRGGEHNERREAGAPSAAAH
ncbi:MAG: phosphatase PAP2 family protein [Microbacteriaceae bacterium]